LFDTFIDNEVYHHEEVKKLVSAAREARKSDSLGAVVIHLPARGVSSEDGAERALHGSVTLSKKGFKTKVISLDRRKQKRGKGQNGFSIEIIQVTLEPNRGEDTQIAPESDKDGNRGKEAKKVEK